MMHRRGLSMTSAVVASRQQLSCDVAEEAVLLSMQTGEYYGLNPVATSIWKLVQHPRTVAEVLDTLLEEYTDVSADDCKREVLAFLSEMIALELVEVRESGEWRVVSSGRWLVIGEW